MANERMVSYDFALQMLKTGFEWEAALFIETYKELKNRFGKDIAREILGKGMYRAGIKLGEEMRSLTDKRGPQGMGEAWDKIYGMGSKEAMEFNPDRFVFRGTGCVHHALIKRFAPDLSDEELVFLGQAYCAGDVGQARGFDPDMKFQHTCRMLNNDECCIWDYSAKPQEKHPAAVPEEDFK